LARAMYAAGLGYVRRDNCFTWPEHPLLAQHLMDQQVQAAWPELPNQIAHSLSPHHAAMFQAFPVNYYWSAYQSEWATDVLFRVAQAGAARADQLPQPRRDALPRAPDSR
jgi:hypothetical protein